MRTWFLSFLFCLALRVSAHAQPPSPAAPAPATPLTTTGPADRGARAFNLGRFEEAIGEYRKAYELREDPEYLFNIAQGYRQLGRPEQALFFFKRYLATAVAPANRADVQELIAELEPQVTERLAEGTPGALEGPRAPQKDVSLLPGTSGVALAGANPAPVAKKPLVGKWWFWTGIGGVLAAGLITTLLLTGRSSQTNVPMTNLGNTKVFE